jgi:aryl-alcohol dehydrogenase-like predicted oxidoreductase
VGLSPDETFPSRYVRECSQQSLNKLELEAIDVKQGYVWQNEWVGEKNWLEAVEDLKREGKIRFFGTPINDYQLSNAIKLIETCVVDTVQLIYNVFDNSPEEGLFPAWYKHNIGVIVRVPFNEGALAGTITPETTFEEGDLRNDYFRGDRKREVYERVRAIVSERGVSEDEMAKVALCYVLSYSAALTGIPDMRSVCNVKGNMAVGDGKSLPEGQV